MKRIPVLLVVLILQVMLAAGLYSQQGWYIQQSNFQHPVGDVFFIDSQTGWITSDSGRVYKSTDGGAIWTMYTAGTNYTLYSIRFINSQTGWAAGGLEYYNPFSMEYAVIVKTTNGGVNWVTQFDDSWGPHFNTLSILDINTVYAIGEGTDMSGFASNGICVKTTNGGLNWVHDSLSGMALSSMSFINSQTGWIYGYYWQDIPPTKRFIFRTTNSGITWTTAYIDTLHTAFPVLNSKVFFTDANTGYFVDNVPRKSINGGYSWVLMDSLSTYGSRNLFFSNSETGWLSGYVSGNNFIRRTTNGGINWTDQYTPASADRLYFINSNTGWGINSNGQLIKTTSGGVGPLWDTASIKYNPLAVGNKYIYYYEEIGIMQNNYYVRAEITRDTIMDGSEYFKFTNFPLFGNNWIRYDSTNGFLVARTTNGGCAPYASDKIVDSLASKINNECNGCLFNTHTLRRCTDTSNVTLFGNITTKSKKFRHDGLTLDDHIYARNIGLVSKVETEAGSGGAYTLKGCFVNGVLYGDTNMYYTITGTVRYTDNNQPVTAGRVKAIKLNRVTGGITFVDSADVQPNGTYTLTRIRQDSVYIGLYPVTTPPRDYLISYYPATSYWETAIIVYPEGSLSNIDLGAIRMSETPANNSVNGKVMRLIDSPAYNLSDANLYAKCGGVYVRCVSTNENGEYHLVSLPPGELKIIVNRLGFKSDSTIISMNSSRHLDSVNFYLRLQTQGIIKTESLIPADFSLSQNYPNPFNPVTNIKFGLPANGFVKLTVYNILGQEMTTLINENMTAGSYAVTWNASDYPSGVYFYRMQFRSVSGMTGDYVQTRRMALVK